MTDISLTRRRFLKAGGLGSVFLASGRLPTFAGNRQKKRLNILLITADDMSWNAPGCFGGRTPDVTPNIDRLASEGMRCAQNRWFGYIFNPWSAGRRVFKNESQAGLTFNAMKAAAQADDSVAARVKFFQYRVVEEFYDFQKDADALHNLVDDPDYTEEINSMRKELLAWMKKPATEPFESRTSPSALQKFMAEQDAGASPKKAKPKKQARKAARQE